MVLVSNKKIQFDKVLQNFEKSNISKSISGANCIFTGKMKSINSD